MFWERHGTTFQTVPTFERTVAAFFQQVIVVQDYIRPIIHHVSPA